MTTGKLWPNAVERELLGRFYLANTLSESLNIIFPFQFIYLYLVMDRPEWAPLPLLLESAAYLVFEIPTGICADRWGRKTSVILGYIFGSLAWLLVPFAAAAHGTLQLIAICGCFTIVGMAGTLVSGASEAWVIDNLAQARQKQLGPIYFARSKSFASCGAVIAACLALLLLSLSPVSRPRLDLLWQIMAAGMFLTGLILRTIPGKREKNPAVQKTRAAPSLSEALKILRTRLPLLYFIGVLGIASFAASIADEAFDISLISRGMDARALAMLGIVDSLVWIIAPLLGFFIARQLGVKHTLVLFLILPAAATALFFFSPGLLTIIALYLLLDLFDGIWDPVADAQLHALIPSESRATLASISNQFGGLAEIGGIALFSLMLGKQSEQLRSSKAARGTLARVGIPPEKASTRSGTEQRGLPLRD